MSGIVSCNSHVLIHLLLPMRGRWYYFCFTIGETEVVREILLKVTALVELTVIPDSLVPERKLFFCVCVCLFLYFGHAAWHAGWFPDQGLNPRLRP